MHSTITSYDLSATGCRVCYKHVGLTLHVTVLLQVGRADWSRNGSALTDTNWWKGTLKPRPAVDWYLERINSALDELKREVDGAPITLLGHSVSGLILYMVLAALWSQHCIHSKANLAAEKVQVALEHSGKVETAILVIDMYGGVDCRLVVGLAVCSCLILV